jgi:hypothetical protein
VFWKIRKNSVTISAEMHERITGGCDRINEVPSAVLRYRPGKKRVDDGKRRRSSEFAPILLCSV